MDERTRKKHLAAIRYGLNYFEGHKAAAVKDGVSAQDIVTSMQAALGALGFEAVAAEAYYNGVKSGSDKTSAHYRREVDKLKKQLARKSAELDRANAEVQAQAQARVHVFPAAETSPPENINCNFEPQIAGGFDFPNIGRGLPKEAAL